SIINIYLKNLFLIACSQNLNSHVPARSRMMRAEAQDEDDWCFRFKCENPDQEVIINEKQK
ncbi:MAG: hypothetical protein MI673_10310, partial [Thiotrichales bacterium]|nr:hypothetical protein [Thiotrichales bacterium]